MYLSTSGGVFIHYKAGTDANTWALITDVPQPDLETHSVTTTLAASNIKKVSNILGVTTTLAASRIVGLIKSATASLTASTPIKSLGINKSSDITLTPSVLYYVDAYRVFSEVSLSVSCTQTLNP